MIGYLVVAAGAAVGAPLRYLTDRAIQSRTRRPLPWGTLTVNVVGSAVLGLVTGLASRAVISPQLLLLLGTGLCGALTTWSTLAYETVRLTEMRARLTAVAYLVGSVVLGFAAAVLAHLAGSH